MSKIKFICLTCQNKNKHNTDRPNFTPWQTEYDNFSEAVHHLIHTDQDRDELMHHMDVEIVE